MNMQYHPKISIITITYNSEKTLENTIKSVLAQNYDSLEYIIVDGGSTDKTLEIIKQYDDFVTRWISEADNGISDAFNKGIRMATGEIIGIINSDDGLCDGALNALAKEYDPNVDVYRGNVLLWNTETNKKVLEVPSMHIPYSGLKVNISHQGTFVRKDAYEKYGVFNTSYKYSMDLDLLMRFERMGARFKYINYTMAFFTMGGLTFSEYTKERRIQTEKILRSHGATEIDIWKFRVIKYSKVYIKKIIPVDVILKIKNIGPRFCDTKQIRH